MGRERSDWEQMIEADPDYPGEDSDNWWREQDLEREEVESDE